MSNTGYSGRLVVVGAGVIGLSVAWRASVRGWRVTVVDPEPGSGASGVAGGMLAPLTEAWPGEERLVVDGLRSLRMWPDFAAALTVDAGSAPGLRTDGTVAVAVDSADRGELDRVAEHLSQFGQDVERLTGRELRGLEPALGPAVRSGLLVPGDLAVDNRLLLSSLRAACERREVVFVPVPARQARPGAADLADGSTVDGDVVVVAAGAWSAGLHPRLSGVIRPVKGEIIRLRARPSAVPPPVRTVRGHVHGRHVYLVPRDGGGVVLGATQYEAGFDTDVTVGGVRDLLRDAEEIVPGLSEYVLVEARAGVRPGSRDNLPQVGWLEPGVLAATGHHRNGILLAPLTADAVLRLLSGHRSTVEEVR